MAFPGQRSVYLKFKALLVDSASSQRKIRLPVYYGHNSSAAIFPPDAEGVFYYHNAEAQIRFRLCKTLEEFDGGLDLQLPNSRIWNVSLAMMARNPSRYAAVLALLKHEFPIAPPDVDSNRDNHRLVSTFSPQRLVTTDQRILNISGLTNIRIRPRGKTGSHIHFDHFQHRFPDNAIGVFYYRQSDTSPMQLGELRFRLCSDIRTFDLGSDLLLQSGQPWFISSHSLRLVHTLKSVHEHLVEEGLLEHNPCPGASGSLPAAGVVRLTSLGQPFVVDLSAKEFGVKLVNPNRHAGSLHLAFQWAFRKALKPTEPPFSGEFPYIIYNHLLFARYTGRAIVRLEQYHVSPNPTRLGLAFALRILEFLTPVKRLSTSNDILDPIPGQLLMHRQGRTLKYGPWLYSPRKFDTRAAIADWIHAQSNPRIDSESV